ncbi:MAG TPA: FKBP-type peptidyl-prolyl cis-trans isomerase [Phycisphaerales bacterium]|nr:FKBP-type peptidyl-prolyl cis-trans isomerase [Phycisphaerales bacterium]
MKHAALIVAATAAGLMMSACAESKARRGEDTLTIVTMASGLSYTDLKTGEGDTVQVRDVVTVNFVAKTADGAVFDSSEMRKRPLVLDLGSSAVIAGLREGVPGARVGGKRLIHVPWKMGYGEQGRPPIPPKSDLDFEIDVLSVKHR